MPKSRPNSPVTEQRHVHFRMLVVALRWSHVTDPRMLGLSNCKVLVVLCKLLLVGTALVGPEFTIAGSGR
jgi:hypothetical protein